mgnify:CR=1 FL=1
MTKERLLILLVLVGIQSMVYAGARSFQQAKYIAERQAARLGIVMDESVSSRAKSVRSRTTSGEIPAYYVFPNGENKGFTIVSGDDRLPEIVGYSSHGTYDEASLPANYVDFMKAYQEMVEAMEKGDANATACMAEAKALRSSNYQQSVVSPLLGEIAWNQYAPYNNMCPIYSGTKRAVTGCVATAMAQVMMYYQYPKELKEDIPSYVTKSHGLTIPTICKGEKYDWDNMLPIYSTNDYNDVQAAAVAKLMYHCGAAVKMNYSSSSGASVSPAHLSQYFGYDADMMMTLYRVRFTLTEWTQIIDRELEARRPILYSGMSSTTGHEFVCDGADGNGLYHINWGWGGSQNGYFDITILNPKKGGAGSGNAPDGYNRSCSMIVGIAPDNGKVDEPVVKLTPIVMYYNKDASAFELTNSVRDNVSEKFSLSISNNFINQASEDFNGYLAYGIKKSDGSYIPISSATDLSIKGATSKSYYLSKKRMSFGYAFPVGKTVIYALYSTDQLTWKPCAYQGMDPFVVEATPTTLSIFKELLSVSLKAQDDLLSGMENEFLLSISNTSDIEYLGALNIYTNTTSTLPSSVSESLYLTVPAHATINRIFSMTPNAGDLYVWVTDKNGETLINDQKFTVNQSVAPQLTVVKAWSNATPDLYETENATYGGNGAKVKAPKVEDEKVVFSYSIRNDGGTAVLNYMIIGMNCEKMSYSPSYETVRLPGNGEITTISREYTPESVGSNTICSDLVIKTGNDIIDYSSDLSKYKLWIVGENSWYRMKGTKMIVYVTGKATDISFVSTPSYIRGGKGYIEAFSDTSKRLNIYNLNGQKVADVELMAGQQYSIALSPGIYIVEGTKIMVR